VAAAEKSGDISRRHQREKEESFSGKDSHHANTQTHSRHEGAYEGGFECHKTNSDLNKHSDKKELVMKGWVVIVLLFLLFVIVVCFSCFAFVFLRPVCFVFFFTGFYSNQVSETKRTGRRPTRAQRASAL
jgi:hypothetical protein